MKIDIAYFNDVHGYLEPHQEIFFEGRGKETRLAGGYARLKTLIEGIKAKNQNTLVFDGGDTFHGTLPVLDSKGEILPDLLNKMHIRAMVGHWDFAYGKDQLLKLQSMLSYPILGCNVYQDNGSLLLDPYLIIPCGEVSIGVIGICSSIIDKTMPSKFSEGLKVTDGAEELPKYVAEVKGQGVDIIILLSHNGYPQDLKMISEVAGIDICLSAHTHNRLFEPTLVGETIVIQCGCHGSFLGHLSLDIAEGKISSYDYQLIPVLTGIAPEKETAALIDQVLEPYRQMQAEEVGMTETLLHRYDSINSSMDELLLRSIKSFTRADVAFSNGWRYGAPIPAGVITRFDLYNMVPMNPVISIVELTGKEILGMLEENLERTFSADPMGQMGGYVKRCLGIKAYMRIENPKKHRIQQLFIGDQHVEDAGTYLCAFITSQGVPEDIGKNRKDLTDTTIDAIVSYLQSNNPYSSSGAEIFSLV
ncbi:bifunctional metallophosphatase/5'-nucleotidase [Pedobacter suwonensis]|uniref:bifunctional metallophosphatase/5'-nucleotidase n=1 Tax=Pedobacter suwonensis TaxID=332999 RepID=UPI0036A74279